MTKPLTSPNLYALLVGIDQYNAPITPLKGCVNDINKIYNYLEAQKDHFKVLTHKLLDKEATKANIINEIRNHLSLAQKEDTILLYYSGHGTQEEADEVFWTSEADRKLESLVCYDSITSVNNVTTFNLLSDKELRFLLYELSKTKAHIVSIFDCCHSGGNTRNGNFDAPTGPNKKRGEVNIRRLSMAFPKRNWADFVFGKTISRQDIEDRGLAICLPEGEHLQMAACQRDESAYEVNGAGVFTKNLLEVLERCNGNISYHRLQSVVQGYLRHQFNQTPKIYTSGTDDNLFSGFLNKETEESHIQGNVTYNKSLGWVLDMGSIQGMVSETELQLEEQSSASTYKAKIESVNVTHSIVSFVEVNEADLEKDLIFTTRITSFFTHALLLYIHPSAIEALKATSLIKKIKSFQNLNITEVITNADFCLMKENGFLQLTRPGWPDVPIVPVLSLDGFGKEQLNKILNYLDHLARYTFVKYLYNPVSFLLQPNFVTIAFYTGEEPHTSIPLNGDELYLSYKKIGNKWSGSVRIKLKNNAGTKLYCALCYLSFNFGVYTKMLSTGVVGLDSREEVWARDGSAINFKLESEVIPFKYKESTSYLKLLISTEDFTSQLSTLNLEDLPGPLEELPKHRGLETTSELGVVHDWTSRLITIHMPNPELK